MFINMFRNISWILQYIFTVTDLGGTIVEKINGKKTKKQTNKKPHQNRESKTKPPDFTVAYIKLGANRQQESSRWGVLKKKDILK